MSGKIPVPIGSRILVEELITSLTIRERGKRAGITVITAEDETDANKMSMGVVLAIGKDPFIQENGIDVGKVVYFNRFNGDQTLLEGKRYRTLELQHITNVLDEMPESARPINQLEEVQEKVE